MDFSKFDLLATLLFLFIGGAIGFIGSALANYKIPDLNRMWAKGFRFIGVKSQYSIIGSQNAQKIFDDVISLEIDSECFSSIASEFIEYEENDNFLITNIKEPWWFYKEYKDKVKSQDTGSEESKKLWEEYEKLFKLKPLDFNKINNKLKEISETIFSDMEGTLKTILPHLRTIYEQDNVDRIRVSFFNVNPHNLDREAKYPNFTTLFCQRNADYKVYFFENIINTNTISLFVNIKDYHNAKYSGTDALILNKRIVLNHDDSIKELIYVEKDLIKAINSGFFHQITKDIDEYKQKKENASVPFQKTNVILEKLYGIRTL